MGTGALHRCDFPGCWKPDAIHAWEMRPFLRELWVSQRSLSKKGINRGPHFPSGQVNCKMIQGLPLPGGESRAYLR